MKTERFSGHYYVHGVAGDVSYVYLDIKHVGLLKVFLSDQNLPILSITFCDKDRSWLIRLERD